MFLSIHFLCCRRFYSKVQVEARLLFVHYPATFTSSGQISAWRVSATSSWSVLCRSRCYAPNEHRYCILWQCLWVWQLNLIDKYVQASFNVKHQCIKASNQSPVIMCRKINSFRVTAPPEPNDWLCKNGTSMPVHPLAPGKDLITIAHLDSAIPAQCNQTLCAQKMQTC